MIIFLKMLRSLFSYPFFGSSYCSNVTLFARLLKFLKFFKVSVKKLSEKLVKPVKLTGFNKFLIFFAITFSITNQNTWNFSQIMYFRMMHVSYNLRSFSTNFRLKIEIWKFSTIYIFLRFLWNENWNFPHLGQVKIIG